jgi:hypothetical protein
MKNESESFRTVTRFNLLCIRSHLESEFLKGVPPFILLYEVSQRLISTFTGKMRANAEVVQ